MSRDRILEDALRHELRGASAPTGQGCVDAETLAAWEDGGLNPAAMEAVELHLSTCARCQAMAAASARGLAGQQASRPADATVPSSLAFWKWLAPLAAGAAAVTLWMVVPDQREIAEAPPQPPAATAESTQPAPAAPVAPAPAPEPVIPQEAAKTTRQDAAIPREREARKEQASADALAVQQASPIVAESPAAAPVAGLQRNAGFAFVPIEIISPAPTQRWRLSPIGIERSTDAGANWALVRAAAGETMTAGTSPSPSVCWMIGNNGVVLLSTNGSVFTRVDIPDAGDLRAITATSGTSATVTNAAGRTFQTDDSGRTWR